jgi:thiamine transport system substrate-binding protein
MMRRLVLFTTIVTLVSLAAGPAIGEPAIAGGNDTTITLMTHDSFAVSKKVLQAFEKRTGISVEILHAGDAGAALNQAILSKGDPLRGRQHAPQPGARRRDLRAVRRARAGTRP